jgi:hypothetical protein
MMQIGTMAITRKKATAPGITVRFPVRIRKRVDHIARLEHRSAAAYIEALVERDLREREETERVVRIYNATDVPPATGEVVREEGETQEQHAYRSKVLNALFGVR